MDRFTEARLLYALRLIAERHDVVIATAPTIPEPPQKMEFLIKAIERHCEKEIFYAPTPLQNGPIKSKNKRARREARGW